MTEVHERYEMLMMRVLDGEADEGQRLAFEEHRTSCVACATEFREFSGVKQATDEMRDRIVQSDRVEPVREGGAGRSLSAAAYALLLGGSGLVLAWWVWAFLWAPALPLPVKLGVGAAGIGLLLLMVRTLTTRMSGKDPYKEIDR